ncbi:MAG: hypothetical protein K6G15_02540 [Desulfovibrio sp.]|nr:hypothetical protein [Desulfovibrio sp.]
MWQACKGKPAFRKGEKRVFSLLLLGTIAFLAKEKTGMLGKKQRRAKRLVTQQEYASSTKGQENLL